MGCDIHIVIERRLVEGKAWIGIVSVDALKYDKRPPVADRYYSFFAAVAAVRGPGKEPLGLPNDASDLAAILASEDGVDGHSHSWMMADEFVAAFRKVAGDDAVRADDALGVYIEEIEQYRVVFWFDN